VSFRFQWLAAPRVGVRANRQQITELMAQQHGVVSGAQLDRLGVSRGVVRTAVRHGWLALAARGVYRSTAVAITFDHRVMVGLLALGHEAVVSHRAAAHLHEFDRSSPDVVEFTVPRGARNAKLDLPVHSTFVLPPIDRVTVGDYPCTSATRTIIDLARLRVPPPQLEAAIDSAHCAVRVAGVRGCSMSYSSTRADTRCSNVVSSNSCVALASRGRRPR
jgi:Transcriptional regulator, AbiEi antitoxin